MTRDKQKEFDELYPKIAKHFDDNGQAWISDVVSEVQRLIIEGKLEELKKLKWQPRESWEDDVVRHNGMLDTRITELEKEL